MQKIDRLKKLYDRIPRIACKKLCSEHCRAITLTKPEFRNLASTLNEPIKLTGEGALAVCPILDQSTGTCRAYAARPLICRLYGTVPAMKCPYGCVPDRWLTNIEGRALLQEAIKIAGGKDELVAMDQELERRMKEGEPLIKDFEA